MIQRKADKWGVSDDSPIEKIKEEAYRGGFSASCQTDVSSSILLNTGTGTKFILPLEMRWQPKEDITTYELAKCLPYLLRYNGTMPYEIDKSELHFRHFEIIDHNR